MFTFNRIELLNYSSKEEIYSKLIRNKLPFKIETHNLQQGTNLQIRLLRDHPSVEKVIKAFGKVDKVITNYISEHNLENSVIRLKINEESFMIDTGKKCRIVISEFNTTKEFSDFPKGKAAILIDFFFDSEIDSSKVRGEIKQTFKIGEEKE